MERWWPGRASWATSHVSDLLQETLLEEKATDLKLSALAEAGINEEAALIATAAGAKTQAKGVRAVKAARQH